MNYKLIISIYMLPYYFPLFFCIPLLFPSYIYIKSESGPFTPLSVPSQLFRKLNVPAGLCIPNCLLVCEWARLQNVHFSEQIKRKCFYFHATITTVKMTMQMCNSFLSSRLVITSLHLNHKGKIVRSTIRRTCSTCPEPQVFWTLI